MPCKIDDEYFDCQLDMADRECLNPGECGEVQVSFARIDVVASLIQVDGRCEVCNLHPIGELLITADPWVLIADTIVEGEIRKAVISRIGWTVGCVVIEGGITAHLRSQNIGLTEWAEIGHVLTEGMTVTVRVETVDQLTRQIGVSLVEQG